MKEQQQPIVILSGGPFDGQTATTKDFPDDAEYATIPMDLCVVVYAQIEPRVWGFSHLTKDLLHSPGDI